MRVAIFDLETSSLRADTGVLLCSVIQKYDSDDPPIVIRADDFPSWKKDRTNCKPIVMATMDALNEFDIFVAHNGQWFDKKMLTTWALKFTAPRERKRRAAFLRFQKFVDPVMVARKHLSLSRNTLDNIIRYFELEEQKDHVLMTHWLRATYNGDKTSLDYIVTHCKKDVAALAKVYDILSCLVKGIDERGSAY